MAIQLLNSITADTATSIFCQPRGKSGRLDGLTAWDGNQLRISLKCDPERAVSLRERHSGIIPGYYMNKKHWNTVILDSSVAVTLVRELMDHSYELVVSTLSKAKRAGLE